MTQLAECRKPTNGGGCIRDDDFDEIRQEQSGLYTAMGRFQERVTNEFLGVFGAISRVETKVDRLLDGVEIGQVRPVQVSRDWELDEPTLHGREPEQAATLWKARATESETQRATLAAQVAALHAAQAERDRYSDRVRDDRKERLRFWGSIAIAFVTSGGGVLLLTRLLGG